MPMPQPGAKIDYCGDHTPFGTMGVMAHPPHWLDEAHCSIEYKTSPRTHTYCERLSGVSGGSFTRITKSDEV